jgi:uncharacterized membrane protein
MSRFESNIELDVPVRTAYNQWTQFEHFPAFMEGVKAVQQLDDRRLHWIEEIGGTRVEWDAVITEQIPDTRIAWRSTSGTHNAGAVDFHRLSDEKCRVNLQIDYQPEGVVEKVGDAVGAVGRRVEKDLERFKEYIELRGRETGGWRGRVPNRDQKREHRDLENESGRAGWLFLWLLGVPIPVLLLLFLLRGCT